MSNLTNRKLTAKRDIDTTALSALMADGRITWAALGERLGLSAPAAADRTRRLEERGVIRGYTATLDPTAAGFPVLAFVAVSLSSHSARKGFLAGVDKLGAVQECHHVAGDDDYLLKVRCRTMGELDTLLSHDLKGRLGVTRTRTTIALGTAKETSALPIGAR
jgi:Lrp/AsnC family leucine-responsive transcriptional regulator